MNILIVDDDAMIRNWLTIMINQIGSYAIASVSNVPEALTHCAQHDVDLVITDITMPGQTGLDLITELNQRNPAIKTAVLSAYDDYKYIRTALQLGALDYVLKSEMSIDDIRSLLKKLDLFAEYATEGEINKNPSRTVPDLLAHNQSFRDWLHDDSQLNTFPAGLDEITSKNVVIMVLHLDVVLSYDKESGEYIEICERTFESENIFGKTAWIDGGILIVCIDSNTHVEEYKIQIGQKISLLLQRNLHHYANCETLHDWVFVSAESLQFKNQVRETIETCKTRTYYSLGKYIEPGLLAGTNISQVYNVTSAHLQKQDVETAISAAVSFLEECHTSYCPPDRIKTAVIHVLNAFTACDQTITANMAFSATYRRTMKAVCYATKKDEVENAVKSFFEKYVPMSEKRHISINPVLKQAMHYIQENYQDRIALDDVAEIVHLNRNYLSHLFTKQLDVSFSEYIENLRISKSKELLRNSDWSIARVAQEVGYSNQSYFNKVFRKHTGIGPKKYREMQSSPLSGSKEELMKK